MKNIALIGDSITEYIPYIIDKNAKPGFNIPLITNKISTNDITFYICGVSNIGVGSYHKYIWKNVIKDKIDCFVLLIGINNLLRPDCDNDGKETLNDTFEKIKSFIESILSTNKNLLVELLYPTNDINLNKKVSILNQKLKEYCEYNNINYLDLYNLLLDTNGLINSNYTNDGLHPNETGYILILEQIINKINLKKQHKKLLK